MSGGKNRIDYRVIQGDVLKVANALPTRSVDLGFGSPPYEDCRTYGIDFRLSGQAWVDWAVERFVAQLRVCRLLCWVIAGKTNAYRWSATPALFMADLHRRGVNLRNPPIFHRVGIPGSGGPDWWRADYEWIVCATNGGQLPWSDNTATGHPPKYAAGGEMSHRLADGSKRNQGGKGANSPVPAIANPGNIIREDTAVIRCVVGGSQMGSELAHENEAPFPAELVRPFVLSFCPPGGVVWDGFCGSGTVAQVAIEEGRSVVCSDLRESQCDITRRRIAEAIQKRESLSAGATP